ncbi:dihydrodipicolinate synthase family protein [Tenggerimyces flavus]|uniref:Dihydrodipicolinate synthase family protein n=1 Tax=Tenggerimyces flavus TaxID=1708749 RepID=A0ABV7YH89_9ACTN|nr:dihydrodipicolinate synthase family protein [Tenggerimyces flavus]MBM7786773.1 4-hydroxy-tetrahydrodipicolinate synthase [Tenggerimyces flavus]
MSHELVERLRTLVAIPVTPFDGAGELDEKAFSGIVSRMVDAGVDAVTPNGNTSEFYSLRDHELQRALELTIEAVGSRAVVVPGVGNAPGHAADLARAAAAAGAPAVMVHQPVHPYQSVQGWVDYHRAVAEAAPSLGIVAYVRDPSLDAKALVSLAEQVPSLVAVKYAVPDVFALSEAIGAVGADRVAWICGLAERWAPFYWLAGARGFTSGLVSVAPALAVELLSLLRSGDSVAAMALWERLVPMEKLRMRRGNANNVSAVKEALAQLGLCGRAVRPPVSELDTDEAAEAADIVASWGLG